MAHLFRRVDHSSASEEEDDENVHGSSHDSFIASSDESGAEAERPLLVASRATSARGDVLVGGREEDPMPAGDGDYMSQGRRILRLCHREEHEIDAVDIRTLWAVLKTMKAEATSVYDEDEEGRFQEFVRLFWSIVVTLFLGKRQRGGMGGFTPVEPTQWSTMMQLEILPHAVVKCVDKNGNELFANDAITYCCKRVEHYVHVGFEMLVKAKFIEKQPSGVLEVKVDDGDDDDGQQAPELRLFNAIDDHERMMKLSVYWCLFLRIQYTGRMVGAAIDVHSKDVAECVESFLGVQTGQKDIRNFIHRTNVYAFTDGLKVRDNKVYEQECRPVQRLQQNAQYRWVCAVAGCTLTKEQHNRMHPRTGHAFKAKYVRSVTDGVQQTSGYRVKKTFSTVTQLVFKACSNEKITFPEAKQVAATINANEHNPMIPHLDSSRHKWCFINGDLVLVHVHGQTRLLFLPYPKYCHCKDLQREFPELYFMVFDGKCRCTHRSEYATYDPEDNKKCATKIFDTFFDSIAFLKAQWGECTNGNGSQQPFENAESLHDEHRVSICRHCRQPFEECSQLCRNWFPWRLDVRKSSRALLKHSPFYVQKWKDQSYNEEDILFIAMMTIARPLFKVNEVERWEILLNIWGEGGTGKSVELSVTKLALPPADIKSMAAQDQPQFGVGNLYKPKVDGIGHYRVVLGNDMSDKMFDAVPRTFLTQAASGEDVQAGIKYSTQQANGPWEAQMILCSNAPLGINQDVGKSLYRRMLYIHLPHILSEAMKDMQLEARLANEHPFLLVAAMDTYMHHAQSNCSFWDSICPATFKRTREATWRLGCPISTFLKSEDVGDKLKRHPDGYIRWIDFKKLVVEHTSHMNLPKGIGEEQARPILAQFGLTLTQKERLPHPEGNGVIMAKWVKGCFAPRPMGDEQFEHAEDYFATDNATSTVVETPATTFESMMNQFATRFRMSLEQVEVISNNFFAPPPSNSNKRMRLDYESSSDADSQGLDEYGGGYTRR
jgi:hypothetical protein